MAVKAWNNYKMGIVSKSISAINTASICIGHTFHAFFREIDVGWGVEGWGGGANAERSEASVARAKPGNSS